MHRRRRIAATPLRGARRRGWLRHLAAVGVLGVLVWRLGIGPFTAGTGRVDAASLATASGVAVVTTVCCAWRWTWVARGLGVALPLRTAVAACYRSQFLNLTMPGGVLGDVDQGVRHGRAVEDTGLRLPSVVWERFAGQTVLVAGAGCALLLLPPPVPQEVRVAGLTVAAGALVVVLLRGVLKRGPLPARALSHAPGWLRTVKGAEAELRAVVLARHTRSGNLLASVVAPCGHVVTFLVAARTAGSGAAPLTVLPLALVVLLAMRLPNVGGWAPREGIAAWVFDAGGLGAQEGVATAVVYGGTVLAGAVPGALMMLAAVLRPAQGVGRG